MVKRIRRIFPIELSVQNLKEIYSQEEIREKISEEVRRAYDGKEARLGGQLMRELERMVVLHIIDSRWKDHLYAMDVLKEGIGLRGYGQRDPLIEYKRESYEMFEDLVQRIKEGVTEFIFKVEISREPYITRSPQVPQPVLARNSANIGDDHSKRVGSISRGRKKAKIGRNDPCPCGSGKKYKYCCGRR